MTRKERRYPPAAQARRPDPGIPPTTGRAFYPLAFAAIAVVGLVCYCNTFAAPFVMDDEGSIVFNRAIRDWTNVRAIWDFSATRFVAYLSLAISYGFSRLNPVGYHVTNLIIHVAAAWTVFLLGVSLFQTPGAQHRGGHIRPRGDGRPAHAAQPIIPFRYLALFAALLFVSHPVQTQAVTYVVQRTASLVAFFYALAMLLYVRFRLALLSDSGAGRPGFSLRPWVWFAGALVSAILAMLTKQNALTLPVAIILIELFFFSASAPGAVRAIPWLLPFAATFAVIPGAMIYDRHMNFGEISELAYETKTLPRSAYLFTQFNVIRTYLRLLVLPIRQNFDYDYPISRSLRDPRTALSLALHLALIAAGAWLFRRSRIASFGIFFFFLTLSVESSVIPIADVIFEHRVYLPSIGFFLTIAGIAEWLTRGFAPPLGRSPSFASRRLFGGFLAGAALLIAASCLATVRRNSVYRTKFLLWNDTARKSPAKARPVLNLGAAYQELGRKDLALELYRRAASLKPNYVQALANIAGLLAERGEFAEAMRNAQAALALNPDFAVAHLNMGVVLAAQGKYDEACRHFERAAQLRSGYKQALFNWGYARFLQEKLEDAIPLLAQALAADPNDPVCHLDLGLALAKTGQIARARTHLRRALDLKPDLTEARRALDDLR